MEQKPPFPLKVWLYFPGRMPAGGQEGGEGEEGSTGTWQQLLRLRSHGKVTSGKCFQRMADVQITASFFKLQQTCSNLTPHSSGAIYAC